MFDSYSFDVTPPFWYFNKLPSGAKLVRLDFRQTSTCTVPGTLLVTSAHAAIMGNNAKKRKLQASAKAKIDQESSKADVQDLLTGFQVNKQSYPFLLRRESMIQATTYVRF